MLPRDAVVLAARGRRAAAQAFLVVGGVFVARGITGNTPGGLAATPALAAGLAVLGPGIGWWWYGRWAIAVGHGGIDVRRRGRWTHVPWAEIAVVGWHHDPRGADSVGAPRLWIERVDGRPGPGCHLLFCSRRARAAGLAALARHCQAHAVRAPGA